MKRTNFIPAFFNLLIKQGYEGGVDPQDYEIRIQDVELPCPEGTTARYVRVRATQLGTIPEWHPGAGGESFIFIDEIKILTLALTRVLRKLTLFQL